MALTRIGQSYSAGGGGSGTPGGSDTQVQFNDGGSFGGDAGFTYNKTTDYATLVGGLIAPKLIGGTATTSDLSLQTTSGVGETGADMHFLVGNNGATEAMTILNSGNVGIGTTGPGAKLEVFGTTNKLRLSYDAASRVDLSSDISGNLIITPILAMQIKGGSGVYDFGGQTGNDLRILGDASGIAGKGLYLKAYSGATWRTGIQYLNTAGEPNLVLVPVAGNVGIGTTSPTYLLSLGGNNARTFWMERHTTANTAGNSLTVQAGGATAAATDKAGGNLILQPGVSTGTGESGVQIKGCVAGVSGTADGTITTAIQVLGNKLGFYNTTPVIQSTGWSTTNVSSDKSFDANATTIDELADVLGTLITRFLDLGLISA